MTLEEIGQQFGITKERVRQLNARAMKKLRSDRREAGHGHAVRRPGPNRPARPLRTPCPQGGGPYSWRVRNRSREPVGGEP